jgi:predicted transcriptional regulator
MTNGLFEVEKGVAAADRGALLTHEEVGTRLEKLLAEKQFSGQRSFAG